MKKLIYCLGIALCLPIIQLSAQDQLQKSEIFSLDKNCREVQLSLESKQIKIYKTKGSRLIIESTLECQSNIPVRLDERKLQLEFSTDELGVFRMFGQKPREIIKPEIQIKERFVYTVYIPEHISQIIINGQILKQEVFANL
jgi:hypothetical protein